MLVSLRVLSLFMENPISKSWYWYQTVGSRLQSLSMKQSYPVLLFLLGPSSPESVLRPRPFAQEKELISQLRQVSGGLAWHGAASLPLRTHTACNSS